MFEQGQSRAPEGDGSDRRGSQEAKLIRWMALLRVFLVPAVAPLLIRGADAWGAVLILGVIYVMFATASTRTAATAWGWRTTGLALTAGALAAVGTASIA